MKFRIGNYIILTSNTKGWVMNLNSVFKIINIKSGSYQLKAINVKSKWAFDYINNSFALIHNTDTDFSLFTPSKLWLAYYTPEPEVKK